MRHRISLRASAVIAVSAQFQPRLAELFEFPLPGTWGGV